MLNANGTGPIKKKRLQTEHRGKFCYRAKSLRKEKEKRAEIPEYVKWLIMGRRKNMSLILTPGMERRSR